MKKALDSKLFTFILGLVIATTISVYAITASEVTYHDTDVESALDTLYTRSQVLNLNEYTKGSVTGTLSTNRTKQVSINKGNYILLATEHNAGHSSTGLNTSITVTSSNNITIRKISSITSGANGNYSSSAGTFAFEIIANEDGKINIVGNDAGNNTSAGGGLNYILLSR